MADAGKDYGAMSVKDLKALLTARGVDFKDCLEKGDLVARAQSTEGAVAAKVIEEVQQRNARLGGLPCVVVDNTRGAPDLAMVMCHGYGANERDLADIGSAVLNRLGKKVAMRFVFPRAVIDMGGGSYAWWNIDIMALMMAQQTGQIGFMRKAVPDGMDAARDAVKAVIRDLKTSTGLASSHILLGGFSQGAMITTDIAIRSEEDETPAALVIYSGTILCEDAWREGATKKKTLPVLQTHGTEDPLLPYSLAENLRDLLTEGGLTVDFRSFRGPHTVGMEGVNGLTDLILNIKSKL